MRLAHSAAMVHLLRIGLLLACIAGFCSGCCSSMWLRGGVSDLPSEARWRSVQLTDAAFDEQQSVLYLAVTRKTEWEFTGTVQLRVRAGWGLMDDKVEHIAGASGRSLRGNLAATPLVRLRDGVWRSPHHLLEITPRKRSKNVVSALRIRLTRRQRSDENSGGISDTVVDLVLEPESGDKPGGQRALETAVWLALGPVAVAADGLTSPLQALALLIDPASYLRYCWGQQTGGYR